MTRGWCNRCARRLSAVAGTGFRRNCSIFDGTVRLGARAVERKVTCARQISTSVQRLGAVVRSGLLASMTRQPRIGRICAMTRLVLSLFLVLGLSACTEVSSPPGTGGVGGSGGGGTGGSAGNGGTGGDAFVCDDGTSGTEDVTVCTACMNCAATGPCSKQVERCNNSTLCTTFSDCLNGCGDADFLICVDGCVTSNAEGASVFEIAQNCTFCECPSNCDNFDNCRDVLECDDGRIPTVDEPEICDSCVTCAAEGPCKTSSDACDASTECNDFVNCEIQCLNDGGTVESCFTTCSATHPAGAALARDNSTCICAQCPSNCTGAPGCEFY
jgi:hypothetical protein